MSALPLSFCDVDDSVRQQQRPAAAEVCNCVRRIVCDWPQKHRGFERRRAQRHPYQHPIDMTPVSDVDLRPIADSVVVLGKQISDYGLDFFYREPLHYRRMIASFRYGNGQWAGLLIDLAWCRFGRHGLYENGGRFLKVVASPLAGGIEASISREPKAHPIEAASRLQN